MTSTLRRRVEVALNDAHDGGPIGQFVHAFVVLLIALNVVAVVLESEPGFGRPYHVWFLAFEVFSIAVFTAEYGLRIWSIVEHESPRYHHPLWGRLRYAATPMAVIDLLAFLPFYLSFFVAIDLRVLRVLRLVRMLKLTRYSSAMNLLMAALRQEAAPIGAAAFVLILLLIVAASLAYLAEHQAQPEAFATIPRAMWWAVVTLTTVGYGDVVPVTTAGKLLGGVIGIIGLGMVAMPAGLLASGFSEQLHQRRVEFSAAVDRILANGTITAEEGDELKQIRDRMGLSDHQAAEIVRLIARQRPRDGVCPNCGLPLSSVEHAEAPPREDAPQPARAKRSA